MRALTRLIGAMRALLRRRRDEEELDEELRAYLDAAVADKLASGMDPDDAVRAARAEIGSLAATRDAVREAGWESALDTVVQDLRYAARALTRNPGFTLVAVLTLALGIGVNTAIFSIVNALFIRPLADEARMRLVRVSYTETLPSNTIQLTPSVSIFEEWERENDVFDGMALERQGQLTLIDASPVERITALAVSPQWHRIFGGAAVRGRLFTADDAGQPVMVISERNWRARFGGDPAVIGRVVRTAEGSRTVVGVVRGEFPGHSSIDLWTPFEADALNRSMSGWGGALTARLKPGVTVEQAQSRMRALRWEPPATRALGPDAVPGIVVESLHDRAVESSRVMLMVLTGAVGFILLIACVNVAGLVVARGASRTREIAVRAALGAGRRRIARQLLTESVALAVLGGGAGAVLAFWTLDVVVGVLPLSVPAELEPRVDLTVLAFTLGASIVTGLLFGLFPAWRMSKPHVVVDLKDGSHVTQSWTRRTGATLIVVETALALVLLTGAGLMIQSLRNVLAIDPGFDPDRVLVVEAAPVVLGDGAAERSNVFYLDLLERLRRLPGVEAVGGIDFLPFDGYAIATTEVDGPEPRRTSFDTRFTLPGYFDAMGIPLLAGRGFTAADRDGAPCVAMVNQKAARDVWPGRSPIGERVRRYREQEWCEIVGIAGDIRHRGLEQDTRAEVYFSALQGSFRPAREVAVVVRAANPLTLAEHVRAQTTNLGELALVRRIVPFTDFLDRNVLARRNRASALSALGVLGTLLAAVGIFGLTSYAVSRRTSEFGIRIALGATPGRILRGVLGTFAPPIAAGVTLGLLGAFALTRVLESFLFGVTPTDPATFGTLALLLALVALGACYVPARGATKVDPLRALRYE